MNSPIRLSTDAFGRMVFHAADGTVHEGVQPVRAYPLSAAHEGVSLVGVDGHELAWIAALDELDAHSLTLVEEALARREFMPVILELVSVSSFATPSTWNVETDRGPTQLVLKGEDDIRRLAEGRLLIVSREGIPFLIHNSAKLNRHSRKLLDRFL